MYIRNQGNDSSSALKQRYMKDGAVDVLSVLEKLLQRVGLALIHVHFLFYQQLLLFILLLR